MPRHLASTWGTEGAVDAIPTVAAKIDTTITATPTVIAETAIVTATLTPGAMIGTTGTETTMEGTGTGVIAAAPRLPVVVEVATLLITEGAGAILGARLVGAAQSVLGSMMHRPQALCLPPTGQNLAGKAAVVV